MTPHVAGKFWCCRKKKGIAVHMAGKFVLSEKTTAEQLLTSEIKPRRFFSSCRKNLKITEHVVITL